MSNCTHRMTNAPIYYALIQVKFTPVAAMSKYIPEIQDLLRIEGFPLFEVSTTNQLKFEVKNPNEQPQHSVVPVTRWFINDQNQQFGFVIGNDFITYQTTAYKESSSFIDGLMLGLSKIIEVAKPSSISRIGLRYLDAVLPDGDEDVELYFNKEVHGINPGWLAIQSSQEYVYKTDVGPLLHDGIMLLRIHRMNGTLGFPPDIRPDGLVHLPRFSNTEQKMHAIIDTDHYVEGNMHFDVDLIREQITSLHIEVKNAFKNVVSEYAISKWS